jgi:hypothetical protein
VSKQSRLRLLLLPPLEQHRYPQRNGDGDAGTDAHHSELHRHQSIAITRRIIKTPSLTWTSALLRKQKWSTDAVTGAGLQ